MKEEKKSVVSGCNTIFCQPHSIRKKNIKNEHENRHHLLCCNICTRLLYHLRSLIFHILIPDTDVDIRQVA